jgi:hypothetical protein
MHAVRAVAETADAVDERLAAAVVIGLLLTVGALAYFDILTK